MSERPADRPSGDPGDTQMFRAFVERGEQEAGRSRRWVLPVTLLAVLVVALVVVLLLVL